MLDDIVMQMRKTNREKGYCRFIKGLIIQKQHSEFFLYCQICQTFGAQRHLTISKMLHNYDNLYSKVNSN